MSKIIDLREHWHRPRPGHLKLVSEAPKQPDVAAGMSSFFGCRWRTQKNLTDKSRQRLENVCADILGDISAKDLIALLEDRMQMIKLEYGSE